MVRRENILGWSLETVPILKILAPLVVGIGLANSLKLPLLNEYYFVSFLLIIVLLLWLTHIHKISKIISPRLVISVLISLFFVLLGYWSCIKYDPAFSNTHFSHSHSTQLTGIVVDEPVIKNKSIRFAFQVSSVEDSEGNSIATTGLLMVTLVRESLMDACINYGSVLVLKNKIKEVAPAYNPHEFDYKGYLASKNMWHQVYLQNDEYKILGYGEGTEMLTLSLSLRQKFLQKFRSLIDTDAAYKVAVALIFGYRTQIDFDILQAFSNTGTIHVLSVSGLHVGLMFGFLVFLFGWLDRYRYGRLFRCILILVIIWMYVILTGMAPSILRAGIMISFLLLAEIFKRKQVPLNTLASAAFLILLFSPKALFDVGFQLSFMAMLGIFLLYPLLKSLYLPSNRYAAIMLEYSYVSIAAQLFTLPLSLYYFGQFPTYFLFANLFIAIPSTVIMYLGFILAINPIDSINAILGQLFEYILTFTMEGLKIIAAFPYSVIQGITWHPMLNLLAIVCLLTLIISLNNRQRISMFISCLLFVVIALFQVDQYILHKQYTGIKIYNVGSSFAMAHFAKGEVMLFSTFDSLNHPTLLFKVLPDIKKNVAFDNINFVRLNNFLRRNILVESLDKRILLLENDDSVVIDKKVDIIMWRKNNRRPIHTVIDLMKSEGILIMDGSNSDQHISLNMPRVNQNLDNNYLLKNNFAYVWER